MRKLLCLKNESNEWPEIPSGFLDHCEVVQVDDVVDALQLLGSEQFDGIYLEAYQPEQTEPPPNGGNRLTPHSLQQMLIGSLILRDMPDGIALLDCDYQIIQANNKMASWFDMTNFTGLNFYKAIGNPEILGAELSPLGTALAKQTTCTATMQLNDKFYQLNVAPVIGRSGQAIFLVVTIRDSTQFTHQRQKLEALHQAGMALADLRPEEIFEMDVEHRIELLKENILHYTKDLLNYDVVEIRLIDNASGLLEPLLSVGIDSERAKQPLFASAKDNGVTGFVAATGKSYMCEDTTNDPLYLDGLIGAKSSLTVPLMYHDQVIGSFNVESPEVRAFNESDLKFVEAFAQDIAQALNTLELLVAQRANTAQQSVEAIHSAVALPIDEILNDTVQVIESYIGHNPGVVKRLKSILKNARDIRQVIQKVGEKMAPAEAVPAGVQIDQRPVLKGKHVLVIDADEQVRTSAHNLLDRYGCIVETAHEGSAALLMIRNSEQHYDAVISDIHLPDMNGYDILLKLKKITGQESPNLILMTGFGYDKGHSIVKARQAGLRQGAVLYKPFRLDQLLQIVESFVDSEAATP